MKSLGNSQIFSQNRKFLVLYSGIPPGISVQGGFFAEISSEMDRSRVVRIENTKFNNISTIMKKVMASPKKYFFARKKYFWGMGMT